MVNDGRRVIFSERIFFGLKVKSFCEIANIAQRSAMVIADRTLSASGQNGSRDMEAEDFNTKN